MLFSYRFVHLMVKMFVRPDGLSMYSMCFLCINELTPLASIGKSDILIRGTFFDFIDPRQNQFNHVRRLRH